MFAVSPRRSDGGSERRQLFPFHSLLLANVINNLVARLSNDSSSLLLRAAPDLLHHLLTYRCSQNETAGYRVIV
jgi:hypothetical protein